MKTTIIVPVYNRPNTLKIAIRSLLRQHDAADLDILIVDDGSTDQTPDVVADLVANHALVRSVHREHGGVAKARNTGLDNLLDETEIVTFLDSDDVSVAGRFAADVPILVQRPDIEVTYGNMVLTRAIDPVTLQPSIEAAQTEITSIHLSCALMRRSLIDRIGRFDESLRLSEDTDYLLRIFETGTRFVQTTTVCLYYLQHAGGMTRDIAAGRKYFALAVMKSMQRRKADPTLILDRPTFDIKLAPDFM